MEPEQVPPEYPYISEIPPPGIERRRLLRQFNIAITQGDYTEDELIERAKQRGGHWTPGATR